MVSYDVPSFDVELRACSVVGLGLARVSGVRESESESTVWSEVLAPTRACVRTCAERRGERKRKRERDREHGGRENLLRSANESS